jgi:hypothetical protein
MGGPEAYDPRAIETRWQSGTNWSSRSDWHAGRARRTAGDPRDLDTDHLIGMVALVSRM